MYYTYIYPYKSTWKRKIYTIAICKYVNSELNNNTSVHIISISSWYYRYHIIFSTKKTRLYSLTRKIRTKISRFRVHIVFVNKILYKGWFYHCWYLPSASLAITVELRSTVPFLSSKRKTHFSHWSRDKLVTRSYTIFLFVICCTFVCLCFF